MPAIVGVALGVVQNLATAAAGSIGKAILNSLKAVLLLPFTLMMGGLRLLMNTVPGMIVGAFRLAAIGAVGAIGLIAAKVALLTGTVVLSARALTAMATAMNTLRGATGMSAGAAGGLINAYSAFGISPETTVGMFENSNPITNAIRSRMLGGRDMTDIPGMAARFQSMSRTPFGNRMARGMLGDMDTPEMRSVLMRPVGMLREQQRFQNQVQGSLGVNPRLIEEVGHAIEMVTTKFTILKDTALIRIASEVLPTLIGAFDQAANWIASNAGTIAAAIKTGAAIFVNSAVTVGNWLIRNGARIWDGIVQGATVAYNVVSGIVDYVSTNGPAIGAMVMDGIRAGWTALVSVADWMYSNLPGMVLGGLSFIMHGLADFTGYIGHFLRGIQAGTSGFNTFIGLVFDGAVVFAKIGSVIANILIAAYNTFAVYFNRFQAPIINGLRSLMLGIAEAVANSPLGDAIDWVQRRLGMPTLRDGIAIAKQLPATITLPTVGFADSDAMVRSIEATRSGFDKFRASGTFDNIIKGFENFSAGTRDKVAALDKYINSLGTPEARSAQFKQSYAGIVAALTKSVQDGNREQGARQIELLTALVGYAATTAANTNLDELRRIHEMAALVIAKVVDQDAADRYLELSRT